MPTVIMLALLLIQTGSEPEPGADYAHYNRFTKFDSTSPSTVCGVSLMWTT